MPLRANAVGTPLGSVRLDYDERWAMAYAASVPDERPECYDTSVGLCVHPMFTTALEWNLITARATGERDTPSVAAATGLTIEEARRGIHVAHELRMMAPLPATASLELSARLVAVDRRRTGATQTIAFTATLGDGTTLWTSNMTSLLVGVELDGNPTVTASSMVDDGGPWTDVRTSTVRSIDAHVYSECARIWNPIHTDLRAARRAGLQQPILHGTATLARAASIACDIHDVPLGAVRRLAAEFSAPVALGSSIEIRSRRVNAVQLAFEVATEEGATAVRRGALEFQP